MADCVFCGIVAGDVPAYRIYEDERTLAFLDVNPVNPGHTLVVPTSHRETITELSTETAMALFASAHEIAGAVERAFAPDGLNLVQANGEAAGQEVFHAHVHVLPRYADDGMQVRWPRGDLERPEATVTRLRDALAGN